MGYTYNFGQPWYKFFNSPLQGTRSDFNYPHRYSGFSKQRTHSRTGHNRPVNEHKWNQKWIAGADSGISNLERGLYKGGGGGGDHLLWTICIKGPTAGSERII